MWFETVHAIAAFESPAWSLVVRLAVLAPVVLLIVWGMRPRHDFVIRASRGRVRVSGRVPPRLRSAAAEFFANDFPTPPRLKVLGRYRPNRTLELHFRGVRSPGDRQRIRNFLVHQL